MTTCNSNLKQRCKLPAVGACIGSAGATDVGSRLTEEGKRSAQRKHELIMQHQKEEADRMQPPKMCPKSAAIVESDIRSRFVNVVSIAVKSTMSIVFAAFLIDWSIMKRRGKSIA